VDADNIVIGGVSRGGALAVAYAGHHPDQVKGVINFVGGWMTNKCEGGPTINKAVFGQGIFYKRPTLWLYGKNDPYYSTAHTRWVFETFVAGGGKGTYLTYDVPETNGHLLYRHQKIWGKALDQYLSEISTEPILTEEKPVPPRHEKIASPFDDVPLPDDLAITKPEMTLSETRKKFSGLWAGTSKGNWNHVMAVESLDQIGGQALFALGENKALGVAQGLWVRLEAVWKGANLVAYLDGGRKAIYRMQGPNRMEMTFIDATGQQLDQIRLSRL
ncbi:MAG: hypothetical protein JKX94_10555, partial [Sneathiella sp.]|nr:hypothetical protein [Sneathiella sp.]